MTDTNPTPKNEDKDPPVLNIVGAFYDLMDRDASGAAVKQFFADIKANLQPARYKEVVDAIEEGLSDEVRTMPPNAKSYLKMAIGMIEEAKQDQNGTYAFAIQALTESNAVVPLCEAFNQIAQVKGDDAGPVVKAFAEEAAKLTDAQYNDMLEQIKLFVRVSDKVSAPPPARGANPFRKGPAA